MNNFTFPKKMSCLLVTLLCAMVLSLPVRMMGQTELTVYDESASHAYVPFIGSIDSRWQKTEYVIPASELTAMNGKVIAMLKYRHSYPYYVDRYSHYKVFLKEVGFTSFGENPSYQGYEGATVVYEGQLFPRENYLLVEFDNLYTYHGGNLLIGFYTTQTGGSYSYQYSYYGKTVEGASISGLADAMDDVPATQRDFVPKTTFTYYDEDFCFEPSTLSYDENSLTPTSVELDWTPRGNETAWGFEYSTDYGDTWSDLGVTADHHPFTLNNLQPGTEYYISVYAKCVDEDFSEGSSSVYFATPLCNPENKCEITYRLYDMYNDGWDGDAHISVMHSDREVASLWLEYGESGVLRSLNLCDGETYSFVWVCGSCDNECSFEFYGPDGNFIQGMNYSEGEVPQGEYGEEYPLLSNYVMQCPTCKKPRNLSVVATSSSASFTWTADSDYNSWELQYSTDETNWSATQTVTGNPTGTINSLDSATEYFARVRANCGDGDYSAWAVISFYTDCATLMVDETHPYSEDFDSYDPYDPYGQGGGEWKGLRIVVSDRLPLCWSSWNGSDYYEYGDYPYIFNDYWEMESNGLKFYVYNSEGEGAMMDQYAILPAIQNVNGLQMTLRAMAGESSELAPFSIGVMTDPADPETFEEIQSFEATGGWNEFVTYFAEYQGQGEYIAIKLGTPDEWESYILYVDDVEVSVLPTCFVPSSFSAGTVSETTATLAWVPYGEETSWQVRYSTDQSHWSTVDYEVQNWNDTVSMQITGLNANNLYYAQVRAYCGNEDYSTWSAVSSFRTECGEYQPIPYYEDFESCSYENPLPQCWASLNTTPTTGYPSYTSEPIYISDDPYNSTSLYFWCKTASLDLAQYAILPYMQDIQSLKMSFVAKGESNNYWNYYSSAFQVGVMTDPEDYTTFQTIMSESDFQNATKYFTVYFDEYQGEGGYIAIKVPAETGSYKYLKVDNILVELAGGSGEVEEMPIIAYSDENPGWNLIALPVVGPISPENIDQMTNETFDLFAFDQNADGTEWQNYKVQAFELENGKGYLYANSNNVTLGFAGDIQLADSVEFQLAFTEGNTYAGWNLVGNPFNCNAYIDREYYVMNEDGTGINPVAVPASTPIPPYMGVFVKAVAEGETVVFTRAAQ